VFAAGDCTGVHDAMLADPEIARTQGRLAGIAAAQSLGAATPVALPHEPGGQGEGAALDIPLPHRGRGPQFELSGGTARRGLSRSEGAVHSYWQTWLQSLLHAGGWEVNICQCEEVTRRELVDVKPPRYLKWESPQMEARSLDTMLRDGPVNQDQIKRLTRAGMGPCQSRRCREQVGLLLARAADTTLDRIPLPTFRPPIRPLPLNVLWPADEPAAMREEWVSWFGIPTQFSPHWAGREEGQRARSDRPRERARAPLLRDGLLHAHRQRGGRDVPSLEGRRRRRRRSRLPASRDAGAGRPGQRAEPALQRDAGAE